MDDFPLSTRGGRFRRLGMLLAAAVALGGAGCSSLLRSGPSGLQQMNAVPVLVEEGDRASLVAATHESLRYFERLPDDRPIAFGSASVSAREMRASLTGLLDLLATNPSPPALAQELDRRFVAYRARAPEGVLFTGYYLPTLPARRTRDAHFRFPVLGRPPDLVTVGLADLGAPCACRESLVGRVVNGGLKPYFSRREIDEGAGRGGTVLAWVEDDVGLFFLQIQGSGVLTFPDGSSRTIGFAASNGHPYVSIGRVLVERGALTLDQASMQGIRRWIDAHPGERDRVLHANPRYVFLRELNGPPVGSLGIAVTGGRTIATDPSVYPPGALALVRVPPAASSPGITGLVFNQDAGAAIRGPGRVDVYLGAGDDAATTAGRLRSPGELYFLAPRSGSAAR
jgi:membrane-bound lytic murein transglycosylase A